jgi:hypothetical protein
VTDQEWDRCTEPAPMLEFLRDSGKLSERKARLFAAACCRGVWDQVGEPPTRGAVEVAERYADGLATAEELRRAYNEGIAVTMGPEDVTFGFAFWDALKSCSRRALASPLRSCHPAVQVSLLREIFGNPFRPVSVDRAWLAWHGGAIPGLARVVYEERELPSGHLDAARLAVVADMLEESGCTDADLLAHLRGPGPHVRGCFAVDALLGRA